MGRQRVNELRDDKELDKEKKNRDHNRQQELLDAINTISKWCIFVAPLVLFAIFIIVLIDQLIKGDMNSVKGYLSYGGTTFAGYFLAHLQRNGINGK